MGHDHHHSHAHDDEKSIRKAFFLNLAFTIIEVIGGVYTQSLAILTDALHDFGDSLSLGLAWYFQKLAKKKRDSKYSYGYARFSLLGAIINAVVLITGCFIMLREAIPHIWNPNNANSKGMILLAIVGVFFNGLAAFQMRKGKSSNAKLVLLHLKEDVLGWVAVLVGAIIMYFTGWKVIDAILSGLISLYILYNAIRHLKSSLRILLQGIPMHVNVKKIGAILTKPKEIESFHDLHVWSLDGEKNILSAHLVLKESTGDTDRFDLRECIRKDLAKNEIHHATLEFELPGQHQGHDCQLLH